MTHIPGQNHNYTTNIPFYTLQAKDGRYLSHPQSILDKQWYRIIHGTRINIATTMHWDSAWVVYTIKDLRELYDLLLPIMDTMTEKRSFPCVVCTGIMTSGSCGIFLTKIKLLSFAEVKRLGEQEEQTLPPGDWTTAPERLRHTQQTKRQVLQQLSQSVVGRHAIRSASRREKSLTPQKTS